MTESPCKTPIPAEDLNPYLPAAPCCPAGFVPVPFGDAEYAAGWRSGDTTSPGCTPGFMPVPFGDAKSAAPYGDAEYAAGWRTDDMKSSGWHILVVARWLQYKLSQVLSQFHLLAITRGRSSRWRQLCRQLIQAGVALLMVVGVMPFTSAAWADSPRSRSRPGDASNATSSTMPNGSLNPFNGVNVGNANTPSFADLDGDGDLDAFIGESDGNINYFQNTGSVTSPAFTEQTGSLNPFNGVAVGYYSAPSFADLDGDGDLDAFIGEDDGMIQYFQNTGSATSPAFTQRTDSLNPFDGVDFGYTSTPSFADLDGDGDLDAFIGEKDGSINYFQNTGSATSPALIQHPGSLNPFNGVDVGYYSTPSFADLDGDGDLDLVCGESNGKIYYYQNTGSATSPAFTQRTGSLNPFDGVDVGGFSAPSFADLDADGDLDAFIGEDNGTIRYIENTRRPNPARFIERTGSDNPLNSVSIGNFCRPSFADIDTDGDLDVFIGTWFGFIRYYQNTGSATSPLFSEQAGSLNPFNSVNVGYGSAPSFADLDKDGDLDAILGEEDGVINYFQNTGSATSPAFTQRTGTLNPFNSVHVGNASTPSFADLDADGDLDAFIGEYEGIINYYENTGTATSLAFTQRTGTINPFNGVDVGEASTPSFADLDGDGDLDAIIGESYGKVFYYMNIGNATNPTFTLRSGSLNPLQDVDVGYDSAPSFADLDGDGDLDAFVGELYGTVHYYEHYPFIHKLSVPMVMK
jgi:carbonic anhydrase